MGNQTSRFFGCSSAAARGCSLVQRFVAVTTGPPISRRSSLLHHLPTHPHPRTRPHRPAATVICTHSTCLCDTAHHPLSFTTPFPPSPQHRGTATAMSATIGSAQPKRHRRADGRVEGRRGRDPDSSQDASEEGEHGLHKHKQKQQNNPRAVAKELTPTVRRVS